MSIRIPSDRTNSQDSRVELSNLIIVLISLGSLPVFLYAIFQNGFQVLSIEFMFMVGFVDLILTADMLNRGYKEQNFYRYFFSHFGNNRGFQITIIANLAFRAGVCALFFRMPIFILLSALTTFAGPLWNTLHGFSFRDDIVVEMPTEVNMNASEIQIDSGEKVRLMRIKKGDDSE